MPSQMIMHQQVYHRQATGHQQYLGRELSCSNDNLIWDVYIQQSTGWRTRQSRCWKRKALRERVGHSMCFEGAQSRNKANKTRNLPIKHGRVFHHYRGCIIISQAPRHLLMWQIIIIITVFRQIFKRHHVGASLPFISERLKQQGLSS